MGKSDTELGLADFLEGTGEKFKLLVAFVIKLGVGIDLLKA